MYVRGTMSTGVRATTHVYIIMHVYGMRSITHLHRTMSMRDHEHMYNVATRVYWDHEQEGRHDTRGVIP